MRRLFALLMMVTAGIVHAHDPGLSRAVLQLTDSVIDAHLLFARADLTPLISFDGNRDGAATAAELEAARLELGVQAPSLLRIEVEGVRLAASRVDVQLDDGDGVAILLRYPRTHGGDVRIGAPRLAELARGHRQYLTVRESDGGILSQTLLTGRQPTVDIVMTQRSAALFLAFLQQGAQHIWLGADHLLFLVCLLLPLTRAERFGRHHDPGRFRRSFIGVAAVITAFTAAHSITLALGALDIVRLPARLVESAIAASIVLAALNNVRPFLGAGLWRLAFAFGLLHGLGFAGALRDLGLATRPILSLAAFNLGVEAGQMVVVALVLPLLYLLARRRLYRSLVQPVGAVAIALLGAAWFLERSLDWPIWPMLSALAAL